MRNLPSVLAAIAVLLVLMLYMCSFQVRVTEVAIKRTFGNAAESDVIESPGLYWKMPWPINSVVRYDKRLRTMVNTAVETRTSDNKNIVLTTFTVWRIMNPYTFHAKFPGSEAAGVDALRTKIRSHQLAVAGKHDFDEFVSLDDASRNLHGIEQEMMAFVKGEAMEEFGIEINMFGIKQLVLPEEVSKAVFESMKKTQERLAKRYQAEGEARAAEILADAMAKQQRILAVAKRKVDAIRNQGEVEVGKIWQAFEENPELRIYLDKLEAMEQGLRERTTLIFDTQTSPIDLFNDEGRPYPEQASNDSVGSSMSSQDTQTSAAE